MLSKRKNRMMLLYNRFVNFLLFCINFRYPFVVNTCIFFIVIEKSKSILLMFRIVIDEEVL